MTWSNTTWAKLIAALTLFIAAFVVAPGVDAATCAPELPSAHASADHDNRDGDHGGGGHGLCSHGHCHHAGAQRADMGDTVSTVPCHRTVLPVPRTRDHPSNAPDGLKRPPRA